MEAESNLPGISAKMPRLHQEKSQKWTRRSAARLALLGRFALCSAWVPLGDLGYLGRLALKYGIDGLCYPVLLASTRVVMLKSEELLLSGREEGLWSLFGGLFASLLSTALEEAMEIFVGMCVDHGSADPADKLVLKAPRPPRFKLLSAMNCQ
ncbi:unnamed protein product [Symbiodinium pilosum]|uniref:Uncharacterized protein n=1 Tax=Symbiodinium pilosum TaxID=2952 RepID=A0A812LNY4_SYMPI|nr:unnamed protein product [Symbiodinium pilosum]